VRTKNTESSVDPSSPLGLLLPETRRSVLLLVRIARRDAGADPVELLEFAKERLAYQCRLGTANADRGEYSTAVLAFVELLGM
jgi:hypothetical protein